MIFSLFDFELNTEEREYGFQFFGFCDPGRGFNYPLLSIRYSKGNLYFCCLFLFLLGITMEGMDE